VTGPGIAFRGAEQLLPAVRNARRLPSMTPFMVRVTQTLDGTAGAGRPAVKTSIAKPVPEGADDQIALRSMAEQLVSEANVVLAEQQHRIDLTDQLVDGQLGFSMRYGPRNVIVKTRFDGGAALAELQGVGARCASRVELAGPDQLESLILLLVSPEPADA
jgi:hypothetical protein